MVEGNEALRAEYQKSTEQLIEVEDKCQETQQHCLQLLSHLKNRENHIERLHE